jgi:uncharacterized lipoprotein YmbA
MRRVAWLVVVMVALGLAGCASAPRPTTVVVNPSAASFERIEIFDAGPIR